MNNGILKVTEEAQKTVDACGAKLHISIQGENFIFGNAAIEKCNDVKIAVGKISQNDPGAIFTIDGVSIKSETGWFAKGSKGSYKMTVKLGAMSKINEVLGSIMELKNVSMDSLEWEYDEFTEKTSLIEMAVKRCRSKAEIMAAALGKVINGIKSCSDSYDVPEDEIQRGPHYGELGSEGRRSVRRVVAVPGDFGTEVKGKKTITAIATIEFYLENKSSV